MRWLLPLLVLGCDDSVAGFGLDGAPGDGASDAAAADGVVDGGGASVDVAARDAVMDQGEAPDLAVDATGDAGGDLGPVPDGAVWDAMPDIGERAGLLDQGEMFDGPVDASPDLSDVPPPPFDGSVGDAMADADADRECAPGTVLACGMGLGRCRFGARSCGADGTWGRCLGEIGPVDETCNGADDDCDGAVDEGLVRECGDVVGRCAPGESICEDGHWSACEGGVAPRAETCEGTDEDCDGTVDEAFESTPCGDAEGCVVPHTECVGGEVVCVGEARREEVCDGLDNDCDDRVDEGLEEDRDGDGLTDCVERTAGLDPLDPTDAAADPDHDGVSTAEEIAVGTPWWPVLSLVDVPTADPGILEVAIAVGQRTPALQPQIAEVLIRHSRGRAVLEGWAPGASAVAASKDVVVQDIGDGRYRIVAVAANLNPLEPGALVRLRFRRTSRRVLQFFFLAETRLAPPAADAALSFGVGHGSEPLRYE